MDFIKTTSRALNWSRRLTPTARTGDRGTIVPRSTRAELRVPSRLVHGRAHVPTREAWSTRPSLATISRARPHRANREGIASADRSPQSVHTHDRTVRPGRHVRQNLRPISSVRPTRRPNDESLGHDRPDRTDGRS
ncbi:unnamed protein product [Microthlaspi erraticum]|uniref:Uncharacterized protein n=1 Tax=Microthlaspi erraticum TaxID=1685480 RepID=A0A6D2I2K1_9BRAS|nr:unnamed protein product [Microthlaspi erraticum]